MMTVQIRPPSAAQIAKAKEAYDRVPAEGTEVDPRVEELVKVLIGRVADKWTMIVLELLEQNSELRFTELDKKIGNVSQKMLTQTLRNMERDGLLTRKVYPVVPPKVEYKITKLGLTLSMAFCGVWTWAEDNLDKVESARLTFDQLKAEA
jgi:DNA-binding HxlR family transcriptional regulator